MIRNRGGKGGEPCDYREERFSPTIKKYLIKPAFYIFNQAKKAFNWLKI